MEEEVVRLVNQHNQTLKNREEVRAENARAKAEIEKKRHIARVRAMNHWIANGAWFCEGMSLMGASLFSQLGENKKVAVFLVLAIFFIAIIWLFDWNNGTYGGKR